MEDRQLIIKGSKKDVKDIIKRLQKKHGARAKIEKVIKKYKKRRLVLQ